MFPDTEKVARAIAEYVMEATRARHSFNEVECEVAIVAEDISKRAFEITKELHKSRREAVKRNRDES